MTKGTGRKYLKRPDVFLERLRGLYAWVEHNLLKVVFGSVIVFIGVAIFISITAYQGHKENKALTAYYLAQKAFDQKRTELETKTSKENKKDKKEEVSLEKGLEKEIFELKALTQKFSGSKASLLSYLKLGEFYTEQSQYEAAIPFYQKAYDLKPDRFYTLLSIYNLGYLHEKKGDCPKAMEWFQKMTDMKKQRVLLWTVGYRPNGFWLSNAYFGMARCHAVLNQKDLAKDTYLRVSDEFPNTQYADQAQGYAELLNE